MPPGLSTLTGAQQALAEFLRLDDDLLAIAAQTSPPLDEIANDPSQLAAWVANQPHAEKNRLLLRVVDDHAATVRREMLRRFRDEHTTNIPDPPRRTVADLLDSAAQRRADRERREAAQRAEEQARHEKTRALAREQRLDELARTQDAAWSRVDAMIATRKPAEYAAATLLTDLQALAERDGHPHTFTQRSMALHQTHTRKPSLIERLNWSVPDFIDTGLGCQIGNVSVS